LTSSNELPKLSDEAAEAYVVAAIILEPELLAEVDLEVGDFSGKEYSQLFEAELALWERGEVIDQNSVAIELAGRIETWVISKLLAELPDTSKCLYYASIVKELSRKRQLIGMWQKVMENDIYSLPSSDLFDAIHREMETLRLPTGSSRLVRFINTEVSTSDPPSYLIKVSTMNGKTIDIRLKSSELDTPKVIKRKIREKLHINPIIPKNFDALIHGQLRSAHIKKAPLDASLDAQVCWWIKEWFKIADEAEEPEDMAQGYVDRFGAYWFVKERLLKYIREKGRINISDSSFWPIIEQHGGRLSKPISIKGKKIRLWGLGKEFFDEEEEEMEEGEQLALREEEDLSWLEEE